MQASHVMAEGYQVAPESALVATRVSTHRSSFDLRLTARPITGGPVRWLKQVGACTLVCLIVGQMTACRGASKNLSRSEALTKLQASPDQITGPIAAQTYVPCAQRAAYERNNANLLQIWDRLVSKGVAELRDSVVSAAGKGSGAITNCIFRLNATGLKHIGTPWVQHDIGLEHFEYMVPAGERFPTEVTGVSETGDASSGGGQGEGSDAQVDFRWEMRPSTSTDLLLGPNDKFPKSSGPGQAIFRRYDDGWRLMGTSYGPADHS